VVQTTMICGKHYLTLTYVRRSLSWTGDWSDWSLAKSLFRVVDTTPSWCCLAWHSDHNITVDPFISSSDIVDVNFDCGLLLTVYSHIW